MKGLHILFVLHNVIPSATWCNLKVYNLEQPGSLHEFEGTPAELCGHLTKHYDTDTLCECEMDYMQPGELRGTLVVEFTRRLQPM